jgi:hypothetical protein
MSVQLHAFLIVLEEPVETMVVEDCALEGTAQLIFAIQLYAQIPILIVIQFSGNANAMMTSSLLVEHLAVQFFKITAEESFVQTQTRNVLRIAESVFASLHSLMPHKLSALLA